MRYNVFLNRLVNKLEERIGLFFFSLILIALPIFSQAPSYFQLSTENGLPSNEVYSLLQDNKGFIWFGCDAGIYKYDGVKYQQFKNKSQKSRSLTGLCTSSSGRIYTYNFTGQLFYIEHDSLVFMSDWSGKISNIVCDEDFNVWVCGEQGVSRYNEKTKKWKKFTDFDNDGKVDAMLHAHSCRVKSRVVYFITSKGITSIKNEQTSLITVPFANTTVPGEYIFEPGENESWVFNRSKPVFYKIKNGKSHLLNSPFLISQLKDSKITDIRLLKDDQLYISTYSGAVIYNPKLDTGLTVFASKAISGAMIDKENNYWFSTLQNGLLRVPSFKIKHWSVSKLDDVSQKVNKIIANDNRIYTTNINGDLIQLNPVSNLLNLFSLDKKADIQCLFYDSIKKSICFNINNDLYSCKNNQIEVLNKRFTTAKFILPLSNQYIVASSTGAFIYDDLKSNSPLKTLTNKWSREICYDAFGNRLFIATNEGLLVFKNENRLWIATDTLLNNKQINSLTFDNSTNVLYVLTFEDKVFSINKTNDASFLFELPINVRAAQLRLNMQVLYIATNSGMLSYDLKTRKQEIINRLDGLSSNEVTGITFLGNTIYLATSLGINQISDDFKKLPSQSHVYLNEIYVDNKLFVGNELNFDYDQSLSLKLSGISYSSNTEFNYLYRIQSIDSTWISLPSTIESLDFQSIPNGDFVIEIKMIDHAGKDSENTIKLKGHVNPPFWLRWWFIAMELVFCLLILLLLFNYRIKKIRAKQLEELKKIKLENELRLVQQSALKAQMNPHFIFNVLNSIKGYIYDNDKKNAVLYLSNFAELMRKILHNSSYDKIKLSEELEILNIYIDLEAMQFEDDFQYELKLSNDLDVDAVRIPGLLIQPYIENAFKHGLRHKKGLKKLVLDLARIDDSLQIKITDNGIGLVASKEINETVNKSHQSFASNATERRIELLNNNAKDIVHVKILDNLDAENNVAGTVVILTIQLA